MRELRVIELLVAFGAGFMLSVAIVELLPAALSRSGVARTGTSAAGLSGRAPDAAHASRRTSISARRRTRVSAVAGTSALVGLLLHTFFDGVAIASAFLVRQELGIMVFVAIFLHKLPEGVTISSLMLAGGRLGRRAARSGGAARRGDADRRGPHR